MFDSLPTCVYPSFRNATNVSVSAVNDEYCVVSGDEADVDTICPVLSSMMTKLQPDGMDCDVVAVNVVLCPVGRYFGFAVSVMLPIHGFVHCTDVLPIAIGFPIGSMMVAV